ncbi:MULTISPECIES: YebC/PmpR family DNA-binding transcriptional regulator [Deinococcus]|jgi:YebC/PmpR family DNA-binding regulatory protein|uniref:YebC/PmpR family DNA-binding regulatory protein n=3 Tax=Deinococcus TaxID=1298 RepID=A0ACC6KM20_9DEIO|nr:MULTISPECIES: YebC/PmpR family DNA-binding transcriptional regulator [Deinococcus]MDK2013292.1 YebC/PmpR family DNA-binding transcriptional regulator [Deinococcus sp. 43]MDR6220677.1 YebC/PmpR family DNA-binding regulatory protein [Deinococcus soli (ex Cha et al. 2016)]MDR6330532.1 YebC/PmpR family DNA-binding regulatory protein [Deinococcus soli (ex Cha et al. 2016)]MDR6753575.1 YebC/PmpR family DNA-binding regulatory protein [Deinococcus soli (ex Cha et al. 2016)]BBN95995.1 putative trans
MAGHSKWSQIKRKKGANDSKRSAMYSKHIRAIQAAVRSGGTGDPAGNLSLKNAIAAAKAATVPVDNIDNAIKRAVGAGEGAADYKEQTYEGYGPGGTAIFIETLTDNVNRTVADIRAVFNKRGGSLGTSGSVAWQFEKKGVLLLTDTSEQAQETAIEHGAEDIQESDEGLEISTGPADLYAVQDALTAAGFAIESAQITMIPSNTVAVNSDDAKKLMTLIDALEDLDDVQNVYSNADLPDEE